jgi:eukaryotic-like serine/threonine-protein kinase
MAITVGQRLGNFEVRSLLGKGGMGEVHRARDMELQRDVALKLLPDVFASDPERLARFQREAQVLASLNHPSIAQIYGLEGEGASRCIVMELVEGETLQERLKRGSIPVDEALAIAKQIAEALEAAHDKEIIHRDLKPANVKITPDGKVKVLDFGLAKTLEEASPDLSNSPTLSMAASNAGVILGTAAYMSPEQAKGMKVDRRSDMFAFGAVLYEMLTGRPAFPGDHVSDILASVLKVEPDWNRLPQETPAAIRRLLRRCLQKDRNRRLQTAIDALIELDEAKSEPDPIVSSVPSVAPRKRERVVLVSALVFVLIAAVLAVPAIMHLRETPPELPPIRSTILPPENTTLDFTNGLGLPALSPDGLRIVFGARTAGGKTPLWVRSLDGLTAQPLAGTEGATFPFWSPDSRFIAFFADGKLKKIDASGGPALTLADAPIGRGGSWSPNGVIVFAPGTVAANTGLLRVSSAGGAASPVSSETTGSMPAFLPGGRHFLYQEFLTTASELPIRVGSLDGSPSKVVGNGSNPLYAQGHLLFLHESTLMAQPFDAERLVTQGEAIPVAEHVQTVLNTGRVGVFSVSETGLLLYRGGGGARGTVMKWFDRSGKQGATIGVTAPFFDFGFSPDRKSVATSISDSGGDSIWIYDVSRGLPTRFTFDASANTSPVWSPDGRSIVFSSNRKGHRDLYRKAVDSVRAEELVYADHLDKLPTSWSADGKLLLYYNEPRNSKTGQDLWALPLTPERPGDALKPFLVLQTPFNESYAQFSPDGRWIAYISSESQRPELYVTPFPPLPTGPGGKRQISTAGTAYTQPRWRQDGKEIFYFSPDQRLMAADVAIKAGTLEVGAVRPLFTLNDAISNPGFDASADGQHFLLRTSPEQTSAEPLTLIQNWVEGLKK